MIDQLALEVVAARALLIQARIGDGWQPPPAGLDQLARDFTLLELG